MGTLLLTGMNEAEAGANVHSSDSTELHEVSLDEKKRSNSVDGDAHADMVENLKSVTEADEQAANQAKMQQRNVGVDGFQMENDTSPDETALWTNRAIQISWVSIVITVATGIIGVTCAILFESMAMLGYGLESFVDVFSSVMVVWRFKSTMAAIDLRQSVEEAEQQEAFARRLEKRAGIGISWTFVIIAFVVGGQACAHLASEHAAEAHTALLTLAIISVFLLAGLGIGKWIISVKLKSSVLKKDAICSLAVAVMSLGVAISAGAYKANDSVWFFDASVAVVTAIFLLVYGLRTLFFHGHRWWSPSFWKDDKASVQQHPDDDVDDQE